MGKVVWILNHYAISPDMPGGTRHYDFAKELVKKGHKVTIFASGFDHSTRRYVKVAPGERMRLEDYDGVQFLWIHTFRYLRNDWRRVANMLSYGFRVLHANKGLPKPDVVIGSSMHPFAVLAGWWLARRHKARFFFEVRDLWPQTAVDMGAMKRASLVARTLYAWEKFMYLRADKIIVLMPQAQEYIVRLGINSEKVVWLPNGVDLERFDRFVDLNPKSEVARVFARQRNKFKVVYAGAHGIPNGLDVVVEAAQILRTKLPNVHFVFVGEGTEKQRLIEKARTLGLSNVSFCRSIPKQEIPAVLRSADGLIISIPDFGIYRYGISPNKSFDYLASAKPIILAGNPLNNIVIEANCGVSVESNNPEELATAIMKIYKLPEEQREQLGKNGRRYVETFHSIKLLADKLEVLLEEED